MKALIYGAIAGMIMMLSANALYAQAAGDTEAETLAVRAAVTTGVTLGAPCKPKDLTKDSFVLLKDKKQPVECSRGKIVLKKLAGKPHGMIGVPGMTAGCCQKPGPDGLHCCDTRDCGWFDCHAMLSKEQKTYR